MTFDLFNKLGLVGFDYSYLFIGLAVISLILLILVVIQIFQIRKLKAKYNKFMGGKDVKSLEKQIERIIVDSRYLKEISNENKKNIKDLNEELQDTFCKVGIVKYDAFKQMGGMLSFSIALLNKKDNGYILNSVHSAEGCYTYVKEVTAGICNLELSDEEKTALSQAISN